MRPALSAFLSRRGLIARTSAAVAALVGGAGAPAAAVPAPILPADPDLADAALRGLARAASTGDPVAAAKAGETLARLAEAEPAAALLVQLYRRFDGPALSQPGEGLPAASAAVLAACHAAVRSCRPLAFGYTDLAGARTQRRVLPLAIVHPPQGIKLLAWCELRGAGRQFFVRSIEHPVPQPGSFARLRPALLRAFLDEEPGRA